MSTSTYLRAAGIGATSGLRSMTGPAAVRWRDGGTSRTLTAVMAAGELLADKLPMVPARTTVPSLLVRALAGGFAGASVARAEGADSRIGAAIGALAAVGASYGALALRRRAAAATKLPDPVIAVAEDLLAVGAGALATSGSGRR